jgi:hypothetical protein
MIIAFCLTSVLTANEYEMATFWDVVLLKETDVSEAHIASIHHPLDGGNTHLKRHSISSRPHGTKFEKVSLFSFYLKINSVKQLQFPKIIVMFLQSTVI